MDNIDVLKETERQLNLPESFISNLYHDDDWSFIVKSHSLLEAALTKKIISSVDNILLEKHVYKLNINGQSGKVSLAKELNILPKDIENFIIALSQIRNAFVHDINITNKTIREYYDCIQPENKKKFLGNICLVFKIQFTHDDNFLNTTKTDEENFFNNPKVIIWMSLHIVITELLIK